MTDEHENDDELIKSLIIDVDPDSIFCDLKEIGQGSFGCVYYARNFDQQENFAIKKISFSSGNALEQWNEIKREVINLSKITHDNCVEFKGFYLKGQTAWIIMEYCIGSASDIIELYKEGMNENEIVSIVISCLNGLVYLHSKSIIHRDIKASNILFSGTTYNVKIGDFGSSSRSIPSKTFVGTPYWMAPEVITTMEVGSYTGKADIWSLGITIIEMIDGHPPLYNLNSMSALYHIVQNSAPTFTNKKKWSNSFLELLQKCLVKDPQKRITSIEAKEYVLKVYNSLNHVENIKNLIDSAKYIISYQSNNLKSFSNDEPDADLTHDSNLSISVTPKASNEDSSLQSVPMIETLKLNNSSNISEKFSSSPNISKHLDIYKNLFAQQSKQCLLLEEKLTNESLILKKNLDKEFQVQLNGFDKEMMKLKIRHQFEMDNKVKQSILDEKKLVKQINEEYHSALKTLRESNKIEYTKAKGNFKKSIIRKNKSTNSDLKNSFKEKLQLEETNLLEINKKKLETQLFKFRQSRLIQRQTSETHLLNEEMNLLDFQKNEAHKILLEHHNTTSSIEIRQLTEYHSLKREHLHNRQRIEWEYQMELAKRLEAKLHKKHMSEIKSRPKIIKNQEYEMEKMYRLEIKRIKTSMKNYAKQNISAAGNNKEFVKKIERQLEESITVEVNNLMIECKKKIGSIASDIKVTMEKTHQDEMMKLRDDLQTQQNLLVSSQKQNLEDLENKFSQERYNLNEKINERKQIIDNRIDVENQSSNEIEKARKKELLLQHQNELEKLNSLQENEQSTKIECNDELGRLTINESSISFNLVHSNSELVLNQPNDYMDQDLNLDVRINKVSTMIPESLPNFNRLL